MKKTSDYASIEFECFDWIRFGNSNTAVIVRQALEYSIFSAVAKYDRDVLISKCIEFGRYQLLIDDWSADAVP